MIIQSNQNLFLRKLYKKNILGEIIKNNRKRTKNLFQSEERKLLQEDSNRKDALQVVVVAVVVVVVVVSSVVGVGAVVYEVVVEQILFA